MVGDDEGGARLGAVVDGAAVESGAVGTAVPLLMTALRKPMLFAQS